VRWLEKAVTVAENSAQKAALEKLIEYYRTGDLEVWDEYNVLWVQDTESFIDVINGFIEVYNDPLGLKGSYESVVFFRDEEATARIDALGRNAQWFEENSPIMDQHKKKNVQGISARVITVVAEAGDASPSTPIGINLPNSNWIRAEYGSKSVNLGNIVYAYDESSKQSGVLEEFAYSEEEIARSREYGTLAGHLHTDMHEVIGHASGHLEPGIGVPSETLKSYASTLEEARADLVALYYQLDEKLVEIGVMPSLEVGKAEYDGYIRNGLMIQLARLNPGETLESAHMRARHLISNWAYEQGKADGVIEKKTRDGQTYFVINDYQRLRELFGQLLREIQRIKSTGDYEAGRNLVETYGVQVDPDLHEEVLTRYRKLNRAPYAGFINPVLTPVTDENGRITDVRIEYPDDFLEQMLYYGEKYSILPVVN
ncbi:MAG TPA: dihydrofolate reductase, partial [Acidobacteriota bacterium]|nr:dihydrofolate reductase [Acidobacteriota bacterium]